MKSIKYILIFCFLIFGIVMQAETFQSQLWNFSTAYFPASRCENIDESMPDFLNDLSDAADKYNVHVFSCVTEVNNNYFSTLNIYGDDDVVRQTLKNTAGVEEAVYTSLISGITDVRYRELEELADSSASYDCFISYIGDESDVASVYQALEGEYSLTYPTYWNATERDMIVIVWGMIIILMAVINLIEAVRRKKEVVIRVSLGESAGRIALKAATIDIVSDIALFLAAKVLMSRFISGAYENRLVVLLYAAGIILSLLPYLSFLSFDVRQAFANVSENKGSLKLLYALKFIAAFATVFTIATNLGSIQGNLYTNGDLLEAYGDCNYFRLSYAGGGAGQEENFWETLYENEYETLNPVICINILSDKNDIVFVNYNAQGLLQGFKEQINAQADDTTDIIILAPGGRSYEENKRSAYEELIFAFNCSDSDLEKLNIKYISYSGTEYFTYLDNNYSDGTARTKNPVIIYQANKDLPVNGSALESYKGGAILYQCSEGGIKSLLEKYGGSLGTYSPVITNAHEQFIYADAFLKKLIGFLSSLCVIVLLLDAAVILAAISLEFRQNAMRISLMKILGYSLYERHRAFIRLILAENAVIFTGMLIYALLPFQTNTSVSVSVLTSTFVFLMEFAIVFFNIVRVERTNIQKTLKGGCL